MFVVAMSEGLQKATNNECSRYSSEGVSMQKCKIVKADLSHIAKLCQEKAVLQRCFYFIYISAILYTFQNDLLTLSTYYVEQGLCNGWVSICRSVPYIRAASGRFAAELPVGRRYRSIAGAQQQWHCSKFGQCNFYSCCGRLITHYVDW